MPENPIPHEPEADVPLAPIEGVTDPRVLEIARVGFNFQLAIRNQLPECPDVELAARYVDLAVQAAHRAAQENPPAASGEPGARSQAPTAPDSARGPGIHRREPQVRESGKSAG
jgi:hypothetical protein